MTPIGLAVARHRVLIVDHCRQTALPVAQLLRALGHDCRVSDTAQHALEQLAPFRPTICLVDLGLPDIDGCRFAESIRRTSSDGVRVIAMTGHTDLRRKATPAGFDSFVIKPIAMDDLAYMLAEDVPFESSIPESSIPDAAILAEDAVSMALWFADGTVHYTE